MKLRSQFHAKLVLTPIRHNEFKWRSQVALKIAGGLREGQYVPCDRSPTFADLPLAAIPQFLEQSTIKFGIYKADA